MARSANASTSTAAADQRPTQVRSLLLRALLALGAAGCPQLLEDGFAPGGGQGASGSGPGDTGLGGSDGYAAGAGGGDAPFAGAGGGDVGAADAGCAQCATCGDGLQNQDETGVDCGGQCPPCACATWTAFGPPERVASLGLSGAASAWGPALSADALTLIFSAGNPEDLLLASRIDRGAAFATATPLPGALSDAGNEGTAFLTFDGLRLYFYTSEAADDRDIVVTSRANSLSPFQAPRPVDGVNSSSSDHLPWVSADGGRIYFTSSRGGGAGGYDLWFARRDADRDRFGSPEPLSELNTDVDDEGAKLMPDELTLFFSSDRAGSSDIWMSTRAAIDDPFEPAVPVAEINGDVSELNPAISADGRELFFSSNRGGAQHELWRAVRSCD